MRFNRRLNGFSATHTEIVEHGPPFIFLECERLLLAARSTDRRNTFCKFFSWGLIEQGLSGPFIELPCDGTELGLAGQGPIGATRKTLAQQSIGVFV
jgi:hypothetical protein